MTRRVTILLERLATSQRSAVDRGRRRSFERLESAFGSCPLVEVDAVVLGLELKRDRVGLAVQVHLDEAAALVRVDFSFSVLRKRAAGGREHDHLSWRRISTARCPYVQRVTET
jgi:hypothetical protein